MSAPEFATLTTDDLVTGEAVALDLPPAGLGMRIASGLIDVVVTLITFLLAFFLLLTATLQTDGALIWAAFIGTNIIVFLVFPATLETLTRGKSIGKLACGLRTVRDDAGPITFQHALVRALVGFVEIYVFTGVPAFFSALLSSRGKRLGDYAAGTYVVRDRVRLRLPPPALMPPPLASWARTADIAALPTGLALAVRQYLGRLPSIDAQSRETIGRQLADQVSAKWSPPSGTVAVSLVAGVVTIDDEGPGIDEADLPHVFERFYRSSESRAMPGSGLGLAIVAQVAERHSGTVVAGRSPSGGTRMMLALPGAPAPKPLKAPKTLTV